MNFADWNFYVDEYMGNQIKEVDFDRLAKRASDFLIYYTQGKALYNYELKAVKMACCAVAEQYQIVDAASKAAASGFDNDSGLESQKVGDWSKTYRSGGATAVSAMEAVESAKKGLASAAATHLAYTGLLYRGHGKQYAKAREIEDVLQSSTLLLVGDSAEDTVLLGR